VAACADRERLRRPAAAITAQPSGRPGVRWAYDYLADQPERNAGLDELAAAGIGKFRLIRLFREPTGLAPTRCRSPTASVRPANYSKLAR
jgi:hypothetical protein